MGVGYFIVFRMSILKKNLQQLHSAAVLISSLGSQHGELITGFYYELDVMIQL